MNRRDKFFLSEIGIEFKAALYFYSMLFFYMGSRLIDGSRQMEIFTVLQMMAATYVMAFVQVFLLGNFDESERIGIRQMLLAAGCSLVYTAAGWLLCWFDRDIAINAVFFVFMLVCYGCTFWLYSFRRSATTKQLNDELEAFKNKKNDTEEERR